MSIEAIKKGGAEQALWEHVGSCLWDARKRLEEAAQHNGRKFTQFDKKLAEARTALSEAEVAHNALRKMQKK